MIVYVVWDAFLEHVCGVFATVELADAYVQANNHEHLVVEEFQVQGL